MAFEKFKGALIKTPDLTFLIVVVGIKTLKNEKQSNRMIQRLSYAHSGTPVLLVAGDAQGNTNYRGLVEHKPIVEAVKNIPLSDLPLQEFTVFVDD